MVKNRTRQKKIILNLLIKVSPDKIEQSDLSKKANIPPPELSHIYIYHLRSSDIITIHKNNQRVFYQIPEEKLLDAARMMHKEIQRERSGERKK